MYIILYAVIFDIKNSIHAIKSYHNYTDRTKSAGREGKSGRDYNNMNQTDTNRGTIALNARRAAGSG